MVLDIPGFKSPMGQSDVRETEAGGITQTNFNTDDFTVTSGVANLKNKTSYWTCSGLNFKATKPDTDNVTYGGGDGSLVTNEDGITMLASVNLPNGAIVTGAITYGNISDESWQLFRQTLSGGAVASMATAVLNTEDTSISNATIDNSLYSYYVATTTLDTTDKVYGIRIKYTTDYD